MSDPSSATPPLLRYRGVTWRSDKKEWVVQICKEGHRIFKSPFPSQAAAVDYLASVLHVPPSSLAVDRIKKVVPGSPVKNVEPSSPVKKKAKTDESPEEDTKRRLREELSKNVSLTARLQAEEATNCELARRVQEEEAKNRELEVRNKALASRVTDIALDLEWAKLLRNDIAVASTLRRRAARHSSTVYA
jgi:hypothetical protein